jgi:hypothetical protein
MLVTVIIWAYLTIIFLAYGVGGMVLIRRFVSVRDTSPISTLVTVTLGLVITAWISSSLSLFVKLGWFAHLVILAGAFLILFFRFAEIKRQVLTGFQRKHWVVWTLIGVTFLATLLYAVKSPDNPDTPLYHAQVIHWIEEYPAIPGLGNLEPRLGSNSNWFTLNALFSFSFLGTRSFHLVPSFFFLLSLFYFIHGFPRLIEGDLRFSQFVKLAFIPFAFYGLIDEISSPGTDLPVILFYWLILCLWLESIEDETSQTQPLIVFLFSIFVITFKVSGIAILLAAFLIILRLIREKEYKTFSKYIVLAVIALLPWLIRNFILTGYWLYPEPMMQTFSPHVNWMIPVDKVLDFKRGVQAWALSRGTGWDEVAGFTLLERISYWFSNLTLNQKALSMAGLVSPVLFGLFSVFSKQGEKKIAYLPPVLVGYVGFLFWLLSAPNFRFGYGFVVGMVVLAFAPLIQFIFERSAGYRLPLFLLVASILLAQQVHVILGSTRDDTRYTDYLILPADYPNVPTEACSLDGVEILCARQYRQCSYHVFPCVPQIPKNVELRGDTFREGFRRISTNP